MLLYFVLIQFTSLFYLTSSCKQPFTEKVTDDDLLSAISDLGITLFRNLQNTSTENFIFSPFSIRSIMTMLSLTQSDNLDQKFKDLLCVQKDVKSDTEALHRLIQSFSGSGVQITNCVFGNNLQNVSLDFIHKIESLNGTVKNIDFNQEEKAMQTMNSFVSHATNEKIRSIIKRGDLDSSLPAVFINVLYFKDQWKVGFKTDTDRERFFFIPSGKAVKPEYMYRKSEVAMYEGNHAVYFDLLYNNSDYSMLIAVPDEVDYFGPSIQDIDHVIENLCHKVIEVVMPKMKILKEIDFKSVFSQLGIHKLYANNAGIWDHMLEGDKSLLHETFIDINEKGTEAAAVTTTRGTRAKQLSIIVDRPFWFAILKKGKTGKKYPALMIGKIVNPLE